MKYAHTLQINAKEIEILFQALQMYKAHTDKRYANGQYGFVNKEHFSSYRCKVTNMFKVIEEIKNSPKLVISEAGKLPEGK